MRETEDLCSPLTRPRILTCLRRACAIAAPRIPGLCLLILLTIPVSHASLFPPASASAQERTGEVLRQLEDKGPKLPAGPVEPPLIETPETPEREREPGGGVKIPVIRFRVEGVTLIDARTLSAMTRPYEGRDLTLSEITRVADAITEKYRAMGYLIAYAYVPAQDITEGVVVIKALEGRVGEIRVTGNRHYGEGFIEGHLRQAARGVSLREEDLERALLILNSEPGLRVRTFLKAGAGRGTSDILARVSESSRIGGALTYDNFGSRTVSKSRATLSVEGGSLAADGDRFSLTGSTGLDRLDTQRLSYGRAEYSLPFGYNGTRLGIYYTNSAYEAGGSVAPLRIEGGANVAGVYVTHPVVKRLDETLDLRGGFDYKDVHDFMLDTTRSRDEVRSASLGVSYTFTDALLGRDLVSFTLYHGIPGVLGGAENDETGTSRSGAGGGFMRYTLEAARTQELSRGASVVLRAGGQFSADPLFSAEQYSIGGPGTVRGFPPTFYSGDIGYAVGAELHLSLVRGRALVKGASAVVFVDHGGVFRNDLQPGEARDDYLTSAGAGLRLVLPGGLSVSADWAVPREDAGFEARNAMIHVQAGLSF